MLQHGGSAGEQRREGGREKLKEGSQKESELSHAWLQLGFALQSQGCVDSGFLTFRTGTESQRSTTTLKKVLKAWK